MTQTNPIGKLQAIVAGDLFSIYYELGTTKMWYSLLTKSDGELEENCVSHHFRRITYPINLLKDKVSELEVRYPNNKWRFEQVF